MARLGDICEVVSGTTPKTNIQEFWDGDINWITPAELSDDSHIIYESQRKITKQAVKDSGLRPFPAGTVILSSRAPIGKVAVSGVEMYCNQGFKNLICSECIYNKYLFWFLKSKTDYLNSLGRGATFKEISKSIVENIDIPLPSRERQEYIAALFDKISDLILLRKQQLAKLDELVKARFMETFGDPMKKPKYSMVPIGEMGKVMTGTTPSMKKTEYYESNDIMFIKPGDMAEECITTITSSESHISEKARLAGRIFPEKSVLVTCIGTIGKVGVTTKESSCNQQINIIVPDSCVNFLYLAHALLYIRERLREVANAPVVPILNKSNFSKLCLPKPPMEHQEQFAAFAEQINKSKLTIQQGLDKLETTKKALMQQYFG